MNTNEKVKFALSTIVAQGDYDNVKYWALQGREDKEIIFDIVQKNDFFYTQANEYELKWFFEACEEIISNLPYDVEFLESYIHLGTAQALKAELLEKAWDIFYQRYGKKDICPETGLENLDDGDWNNFTEICENLTINLNYEIGEKE